MKRPITALLAIALALAACSTSAGPTTTESGAASSTSADPTTTAAPTTTASVETSAAPSTTSGETTTTVGETTTTEPASTSTTLPGDPIDFGPAPGDRIAVVGVSHDDVLNMRAAPGTDQAIVSVLAPTSTDLIATGSARSLPESIWYEVEVGGASGWVSSSFVAYIGDTSDLTADVVAAHGSVPATETLSELVDMVAAAIGSEDPPSRVTVTVPAIIDDLSEVTIDVIGLGDDAQRGWRAVIFASPIEGGEGFSLKAVEATALCGRGLSDGGLCA